MCIKIIYIAINDKIFFKYGNNLFLFLLYLQFINIELMSSKNIAKKYIWYHIN